MLCRSIHSWLCVCVRCCTPTRDENSTEKRRKLSWNITLNWKPPSPRDFDEGWGRCFLARVRFELLCTSEKKRNETVHSSSWRVNEWILGKRGDSKGGFGLIAEKLYLDVIIFFLHQLTYITLKRKNFSACNNKIIKDAHTKAPRRNIMNVINHIWHPIPHKSHLIRLQWEMKIV